MKGTIVNADAFESQKPIDDIVCYECKQTKVSACDWLDGECPLDLL